MGKNDNLGGVPVSAKKVNRGMSTTQLILLGFFVAIVVATVILKLPISSAQGEETTWLEALFTAASTVCVTGLTVVDTFSHWSIFGKAVILLLIQLGGLGVVAFSTGLLVLLGRKITLKDRLLLGSAFNLDSMSGLIGFLKKVFQGTVLLELAGAVLLLPVFVPQYGATGIWYALFHAVSSFCNAGIDILGPNSLVPYATNLWLNLVTMVLIVLGGIGFIVWLDVLGVAAKIRRGELRRGQFFRRLSLHSKITLVTTGVLLLGGWLLFLLLEWSNADTLGRFGLGGKLLASAFQSVTRTAGFVTIPTESLRDTSVLVCAVLMFIGGSSVSAAGGVKTTTIALVFLAALSVVRGGDQVTAFRRTIPTRLVHRAMAIVTISFATLMGCAVLLSAYHGGSLMDILFEVTSALGTAGMSRGVVQELGTAGKLLIICCMYFGRVGPISLAIAFAGRKGNRTVFPQQNITIG